MISQILEENDIDFSSLVADCYTRKLKSNLNAYGVSYDFCRFYSLSSKTQKAIICIFNSSMLVANIEGENFNDEDIEDLLIFIKMNKPSMIEMNVAIAKRIKDNIKEDYLCENRTEFECIDTFDIEEIELDDKPSLDEVFDIVKLAFPSMRESYDMWITDTSHRIRREQSVLYCFEKSSTLMIKYMLDGYALIGQVGTLPEKRGNDYARKMLHTVSNLMNKKGLKVCLFAREKMVGFYQKLGFSPMLSDVVFERK